MARAKKPSASDALPATETAAPAAVEARAADPAANEENVPAAATFKETATRAARQAGDKVRDLVSESTSRAAGALSDVSRMVNDAAETVDEKVGPQYGRYARNAADALANFSETLKNKNADDLIADARGFVRKSPAVAIGIAAALGFVVARVVKAGLNAADNDDDADA